MYLHRHSVRVLALVCLLLPVLGAVAAEKTDKPEKPAPKADAPAQPAIGFIKLEFVQRDYNGWKKAQDLLGAYYHDHQQILDDIEQKGVIGLPKDDFATYMALAADPVKMDKDKIADLEKKAKAIGDEYEALKAKKDPTDADKKRIEELDKLAEANRAVLDTKRATYEDEMGRQESTYTKALQDEIMKALDAIAAQKKLSVILNKFVVFPDPATQRYNVQQVVVWGGADVTADVTKYLNDNFKDTLLQKK
jgi:Skp family chaperone for outer membrane proteins